MNPIAASALTLSLLAGEVQANDNPRVTVTLNGSQASPEARRIGSLALSVSMRRSKAQTRRGSVVQR